MERDKYLDEVEVFAHTHTDLNDPKPIFEYKPIKLPYQEELGLDFDTLTENKNRDIV